MGSWLRCLVLLWHLLGCRKRQDTPCLGQLQWLCQFWGALALPLRQKVESLEYIVRRGAQGSNKSWENKHECLYLHLPRRWGSNCVDWSYRILRQMHYEWRFPAILQNFLMVTELSSSLTSVTAGYYFYQAQKPCEASSAQLKGFTSSPTSTVVSENPRWVCLFSEANTPGSPGCGLLVRGLEPLEGWVASWPRLPGPQREHTFLAALFHLDTTIILQSTRHWSCFPYRNPERPIFPTEDWTLTRIHTQKQPLPHLLASTLSIRVSEVLGLGQGWDSPGETVRDSASPEILIQ